MYLLCLTGTKCQEVLLDGFQGYRGGPDIYRGRNHRFDLGVNTFQPLCVANAHKAAASSSRNSIFYYLKAKNKHKQVLLNAQLCCLTSRQNRCLPQLPVRGRQF